MFRIIPAYAGSTGLCNLGPEAEPDHPRIRGEHTVPIALIATAFADHPRIRGEHPYHIIEVPAEYGSSPHTRGAPKS